MNDVILRLGTALVAVSLAACSGTEDPEPQATGGAGSGGTGGAMAGTGGATAGTGGATGGTGGATGGSGGTAGSGAVAGSGGSSGSAGAVTGCNDAIVATAAQNYAFSSTITLPPVGVQPDSELTFDWSTVTEDLLGHPLNPTADVDMVELGLWELTQEELEMKLNADQLKQSDLEVIANLETMNTLTSTTLFNFTSAGTPLTPDLILPYVNAANYPPDQYTYTVMIATGTALGQGTRLLQAFHLDPASTNTTVNLTDASVNLVWSADLGALTSPEVHAATPGITIDWSGMTVNSMGYPFEPSDITEVLVGHYDETPEELEAQFLDLEMIHEDMWRGEVLSGTNLNLSALTNEAGATFPGISASGTWVVALICGECANPAPWYLTILKPCAG